MRRTLTNEEAAASVWPLKRMTTVDQEREANLFAVDQEREANLFAVCLLMPESLVREWIGKHKLVLDYGDDKGIKAVAKTFGVTVTLAAVRLHQLGYL
jgi:Zn-dependent peptidase ImmA (M78 family)